MKKKIQTALLITIILLVSILGGCGAQQTNGNILMPMI